MAGEFGDNLIVCTAPSKTFNLAAMQTSNIILPGEEDRKKFLAIKEKYCVESMNALGFEACRLAYTLGKGWMEEMLQVIWDNFKFASAYLKERLPMIKPIELQGTYLMSVSYTHLDVYKRQASRYSQCRHWVFWRPLCRLRICHKKDC